jgi:hypothetical protein
MDNFYVSDWCSALSLLVALLVAQRYIKSDLLWVLRVLVGLSLVRDIEGHPEQ